MLFRLFSKSQAYLDPGSGSYFIQMLIAGIAGGVTIIGIYWGKIKSFFSRKNKSGNSEKGQNSGKSEDE